MVLTFACYWAILDGGFVYDDTDQILKNQLIQNPELLGKALTSDVWAFTGDKTEAWSNYWRPAFVLWLVANERTFGLESARGWHITNILLHAVVSILAYLLLRRLFPSRGVSAVLAAIFAVHPVHVESVAWISGSPDILVGIGAFAALILVMSTDRRPAWWKNVFSWLAYSLAQLAKEIAIAIPLLIPFAVDAGRSETDRANRKAPWRAMIPFIAIAAVWLVVRRVVLGRTQVEPQWDAGWLETVLTAPSIAFFYLRQTLSPLWLGPSYPLRPVTLETTTWTNFWGPTLVVAVAIAAALWLARRDRIARFGLALWVLPLLPAFNISAFIEEHIVHDRYLYLPLLGFLILAARMVAKIPVRLPASAVLIPCALVIAVLGFQTSSYAAAWKSNLSLWEQGVKSDPGAAFSWSQYGHALTADGKLDEAHEAFDRALEIKGLISAYVGRSKVALAQRRLDDAEADLKKVIEGRPEHPKSHAQLATLYQQQGRLDEAIEVLRHGREVISYGTCSFTSELGRVLYATGKRPEAVSELESLWDVVGPDLKVACQLSMFHLARAYLDLGRPDDAIKALERFREVTEGSQDKNAIRYRELAEQQISAIRGAGEPSNPGTR